MKGFIGGFKEFFTSSGLGYLAAFMVAMVILEYFSLSPEDVAARIKART